MRFDWSHHFCEITRGCVATSTYRAMLPAIRQLRAARFGLSDFDSLEEVNRSRKTSKNPFTAVRISGYESRDWEALTMNGGPRTDAVYATFK